MPVQRTLAVVVALLAGFAGASCERARQVTPIDPEPLMIHYATGGIWNPGYSLHVGYDHLVLESPRCPMAKDRASGQGFCVVRITEKQWSDFVEAVKPYRRHAVPFDPPALIDREIPRPDGKPCKNEVTDHTIIGVTWFDQKGASYAGYYEGCDREEFERFYRRLRAAPLVLPIKGLIKED